MVSIPWMTASLSVAFLRYGAVETCVFNWGVMVRRPRETAPLPRYCVIVIAAGNAISLSCNSLCTLRHTLRTAFDTRLPLNVTDNSVGWRVLRPCLTINKHMCAKFLEICALTIGPRLGATWASMPVLLSAFHVSLEVLIVNGKTNSGRHPCQMKLGCCRHHKNRRIRCLDARPECRSATAISIQ